MHPETRRTTTYWQLVELLADGEWHTDDELLAVTAYRAEWLKELRYDGFVLAERPEAGLVRLLGRTRGAGRRGGLFGAGAGPAGARP